MEIGIDGLTCPLLRSLFMKTGRAPLSGCTTSVHPSGGLRMVLDFKYRPNGEDDPSAEPKDYINATITQLFYTANLVHDLFYRYGFDEKSGNY